MCDYLFYVDLLPLLFDFTDIESLEPAYDSRSTGMAIYLPFKDQS